jgi:hypothetical protein
MTKKIARHRGRTTLRTHARELVALVATWQAPR